MKKIKEIITIVFGSMLVAFAIYNIHSKLLIAEGGQLGIELLLYNLLNISPAISSFIIDFTIYLIGVFVLGKKFAINAIVGTLSYSIFYLLFDYIDINIITINNLLIGSIVGGILVGIGCGLVVRHQGACGGDDSLAQIIRKITKLPLWVCYFIMDIIIILISLVYIRSYIIIYSLLTSLISSILIWLVSDVKQP